MTAGECVELGVSVSVIGEAPVRFETRLEDGDCEEAWFSASVPVPLGALVKAETDDTLWMGVVAACRKEGESWRVVFRVEHMLRNVRSLLDMASRFD